MREGNLDMRWIPNALTLLRCLCAALLPLLGVESIAFIVVYVTAGVTDALDGFLARRWRTATRFGSSFDSLADMLFTLTLLYVLMTFLHWPSWLTIWIVILAMLKVMTLIIGWLRYRQVAFLHTVLNKLSGLVIFVAPMFIIQTRAATTGIVAGIVACVVACTIASIASLEELTITIASPKLHPDIRSLVSLGSVSGKESDSKPLPRE